MPVSDAPRYVQFLIRHRQGREASILHRLGKGAADIPTIVKAVYIGLDPRLNGAAALSVLAHEVVARRRGGGPKVLVVDRGLAWPTLPGA